MVHNWVSLNKRNLMPNENSDQNDKILLKLIELGGIKMTKLDVTISESLI
jgi:hypothetical protein